MLLDRAWQLWAERGWAAVTLDAAAAAAGVDAARFREEFPADVDLLCEVFDHSSEIRGAAALAAMDAADEGRSRWFAAIESYVCLLEEDPRHVVVLVEAIGSPELRARRRSSYRGFAVVMAGMATRSSADPRDQLAAAHFCIGGLIELTLAWQDPDTDVDRDAVLRQGSLLFDLVMSGDRSPGVSAGGGPGVELGRGGHVTAGFDHDSGR